MSHGEIIEIEGYRMAADRAYHPDTHVWVQRLGPSGPPERGARGPSGPPERGARGPDRVRLGLDPLGVETTGTLAQIALTEPGDRVARGEPLGTIEAEKFVGPLASPLTGTVVAVNAEAVADPRLVHADPLGTWLVELAPTDLEAEAVDLVQGEAIEAWFKAKLAQYRIEGVLAE